MSNENEYAGRILNESDVTAELDELIKELLIVCFGHRKEELSKDRWLNNNIPIFTSVVECQGEVVGHAAIIERMITVEGKTIRAAGVGMVGVAQEHRGKGIVDIVLKTAVNEMKMRNYDIGLLFCQEHVKQIYLRNGWIDAPDMSVECLVDGQRGCLPADRHKMYFPINTSEMSGKTVDLNGPRW